MKPCALCVALAGLAGLAVAGCSPGGRQFPLSGIEEVRVGNGAAVGEAAEIAPAADDWPWWRGAQHDNRAAGAPPPRTWSESENVLWRVEVPGRGHASPAVWGDHVFVATADDAAQTQSLLCYDRATGQPVWEKEIHRGGFMHTHSKNSHASATPACDGRHVFTVFMVQDGIWVTAVDLSGEIVWQKKAGPFRSMHGYGSSPVLFESLVIVAGDNSGGGFLTALHRDSGDLVWRVRRANKPSFGTPIVATVAGRQQLLLGGQNRVAGYDPATGQELWSTAGPADTTGNTIAASEQLVFASGGYPQNGLMAVVADGSGKVVWQKPWKVYVPSPLVVGERLFVVQDGGVARCLQADSGRELWTERLGGEFSASPVLAGEHIYVPNERGQMFVFKAAPEFELVATNDLGDGGMASPVICGGSIYLRTRHRLYRIGS